MCFSSMTPCHAPLLDFSGGRGTSGSIVPSRLVRILRLKSSDANVKPPSQRRGQLLGGGMDYSGFINFAASFFKLSKEPARTRRSFRLTLAMKEKTKHGGIHRDDYRGRRSARPGALLSPHATESPQPH